MMHVIKLTIIISWSLLICSGACRAQQAGCNDLLVTGIELKPNPLDNDSTSFIEIVMLNNCKDCVGGTDYTGLFVIMGNDTLGSVAINGIPRYKKKSRAYPAFCSKPLESIPNIDEIRISLDHYCDDIPIDLKTRKRLRDKLLGKK